MRVSVSLVKAVLLCIKYLNIYWARENVRMTITWWLKEHPVSVPVSRNVLQSFTRRDQEQSILLTGG